MIIDLALFCGTSGGRFDLDKPFIRDGWRWATDGWIVVRMPTTDADTEGRYPKIESLFEGFPGCDHDWPDWPQSPIRCRKCRTGKVLVACQTCNGEGEHECACGNLHGCGGCDGHGNVSGANDCLFCGGTAKVNAPKGIVEDGVRIIEIAGKWFQAWYLGLIKSQFAGLRYSRSREEQLCFTADGNIQGSLCPRPRQK